MIHGYVKTDYTKRNFKVYSFCNNIGSKNIYLCTPISAPQSYSTSDLGSTPDQENPRSDPDGSRVLLVLAITPRDFLRPYEGVVGLQVGSVG